MAQPDVNWQPLSEIPTIAWAIDGMAESAEEQLPNLREAATRPHVMDNVTIDRVLQVYGEQKADLWRRVAPNPASCCEPDRARNR